jgi:DNA-binding NarL/FixJ family response regulator
MRQILVMARPRLTRTMLMAAATPASDRSVQAVPAENPKHAWELLSTFPVDVLVLHIAPEDVESLKLLAAVATHHATVPVIVVCDADPGAAPFSDDAGVPIFRVPVDFPAFADVVRRSLSGAARTARRALTRGAVLAVAHAARTPMPASPRAADEEPAGVRDVAAVDAVLTAAIEIPGALAVGLLDLRTGVIVRARGARRILDVAATRDADFVRAARGTVLAADTSEPAEEIMVTSMIHYHLIRPLPGNADLQLLAILDREIANLAMARLDLARLAATLFAP